MDEFAVATFEYHLGQLLSGLTGVTANYYPHNTLDTVGEPMRVRSPRVIVYVHDQPAPLGYAGGPAIDVPYVDLTRVAVYVETPLRVANPAGDPDELDGAVAVHRPICRAIRNWVHDNRAGLEVPEDIKEAGCDRGVFGLWQPRPPETGSYRINNEYWRHVFHAVLQKLEVT